MPNLNLTPFQLIIIEKLQYGKEHAVTGKTLAKWLGQKSDREIRRQISALIRAKWPILSSVSVKNPGYYMANTKEEVEAYARDLHGRAMEILVREKDLKKAAKTITKPHQLNMAMGIK
jgi:hypothetical protein